MVPFPVSSKQLRPSVRPAGRECEREERSLIKKKGRDGGLLGGIGTSWLDYRLIGLYEAGQEEEQEQHCLLNDGSSPLESLLLFSSSSFCRLPRSLSLSLSLLPPATSLLLDCPVVENIMCGWQNAEHVQRV